VVDVVKALADLVSLIREIGASTIALIAVGVFAAGALWRADAIKAALAADGHTVWVELVEPAAVAALPDRTLQVGTTLDLDLSAVFTDPDQDPLTFAASSSSPEVVTVLASGARATLTAAALGTAAVRVSATDPAGQSAAQTFRVRVTRSAPFTDDPLQPGVTPVRAVHFTELRSRIDAVRAAAGLGPFPWTDPVLTPRRTPVRAVHLLDLRVALAEAYAGAARPAPRWTDAAAAGTPIRAIHLIELRAAVGALE
jgi:hypothetical protein